MTIAPATHRALLAFATVERRQHSLERAELALNKAVVNVPIEDMNYYVEQSQEVAQVHSDRCVACKVDRDRLRGVLNAHT